MTPERLIERVLFHENGCWHWSGAKNDSGYGVVRVAGTLWKVHRYSFTIFVGPIPAGNELEHKCHTADLGCPGGVTCPHRLCVRPSHLVPMTHAENMLQMKKKRQSRIQQRKGFG